VEQVVVIINFLKYKIMPFVSKKQRALCYSLKSQGKAGTWNCDEWSRATKKSLPNKVKHKKK
jgi:hypothetical protein